MFSLGLRIWVSNLFGGMASPFGSRERVRKGVCVCMHVCIIRTYVYTYICMYIQCCVLTNPPIPSSHTYTYIHTHTCVCVCVCVCVCDLHTFVRVCVCVCILLTCMQANHLRSGRTRRQGMSEPSAFPTLSAYPNP